MKTRNDVIAQAADECMKELYSFAQPKVTWEQFIKENEEYSKKYKIWKQYIDAKHRKDENPEKWEQIKKQFPESWENSSCAECIGPRPYEFYYLDKEIFKEIVDSYIYAYDIDEHKNLIDIIDILKDYCKNPIIDKWIEGDDDNPGHKGHEHPDNLEKEINNLISNAVSFCGKNHPTMLEGEEFDTKQGVRFKPSVEIKEVAEKLQDKFFEFLDMAGKFYKWNWHLNSFNTTVYLGASPNSNKEAVIENWKKYRNKDIEIKNINLYEDDE